VRFRIEDVFLPAPGEVRAATPDEAELAGSILRFSDSGSVSQVFAVIEVVRRQTVIVPVDKLQLDTTTEFDR